MHGVVLLREENNSLRRVILKIELELNNLNSSLSRSAVTPVSPKRELEATPCVNSRACVPTIETLVCVYTCV